MGAAAAGCTESVRPAHTHAHNSNDNTNNNKKKSCNRIALNLKDNGVRTAGSRQRLQLQGVCPRQQRRFRYSVLFAFMVALQQGSSRAEQQQQQRQLLRRRRRLRDLTEWQTRRLCLFKYFIVADCFITLFCCCCCCCFWCRLSAWLTDWPSFCLYEQFAKFLYVALLFLLIFFLFFRTYCSFYSSYFCALR